MPPIRDYECIFIPVAVEDDLDKDFLKQFGNRVELCVLWLRIGAVKISSNGYPLYHRNRFRYFCNFLMSEIYIRLEGGVRRIEETHLIPKLSSDEMEVVNKACIFQKSYEAMRAKRQF